MTTGKTIAFTIWTFVSKMMSLLFNRLSRFATAFIPRNKFFYFLFHGCSCYLQWFWSLRKSSVTASFIPPSLYNEIMVSNAMISLFSMLSFKQDFSLSFTLIKRLFSSSFVFVIRVVSSTYLRVFMFLLPSLIPPVTQPAWFWYYTIIR